MDLNYALFAFGCLFFVLRFSFTELVCSAGWRFEGMFVFRAAFARCLVNMSVYLTGIFVECSELEHT